MPYRFAPSASVKIWSPTMAVSWGGNNAGVLTLLVHPIRFGTIFRGMRYGIETPFRAGAKPGGAL